MEGRNVRVDGHVKSKIHVRVPDMWLLPEKRMIRWLLPFHDGQEKTNKSDPRRKEQ